MKALLNRGCGPLSSSLVKLQIVRGSDLTGCFLRGRYDWPRHDLPPFSLGRRFQLAAVYHCPLFTIGCCFLLAAVCYWPSFTSGRRLLLAAVLFAVESFSWLPFLVGKVFSWFILYNF